MQNPRGASASRTCSLFLIAVSAFAERSATNQIKEERRYLYNLLFADVFNSGEEKHFLSLKFLGRTLKSTLGAFK